MVGGLGAARDHGVGAEWVQGAAVVSRNWLETARAAAAVRRRDRGVAGAARRRMLAAYPGSDHFSFGSSPPPAPAAAGRGRHRPGEGRADPAAVGTAAMPGTPRSRCATRPKWRSPNSTIPTSSCWSRTTAAPRRARSRRPQQALAEGAEIILGPLFAHSVQRGRPGGARARRAGDRFLDRRQRGGARRLSAELPAGVRCRSRDRLRDRAGQALVRGADPGQCLWQRGARRRSSRRRRAAAGASSRWSAIRSTARRCRGRCARRAGGAPGRCDLHSGRCGFRSPSRCRRWPPPASTRGACSSSAPACGTIRASSPIRRCRAAGSRRPDPAGFRAFLRPLPHALQTGPGAPGDAGLRCGVAGRRAGEDARAGSASPSRR